MNEEVERLKGLIANEYDALKEIMEQRMLTTDFIIQNHSRISGYENQLKAIIGWQEANQITKEIFDKLLSSI
jgi:hypothetical protein